MAGIAIVVLTLLVGIGIVHRAKERSAVLHTTQRFLQAWRDGEYSTISDLYGNLNKVGVRTAGRSFLPSAELTSFEVPVGTRTKADPMDLPIVFVPADWKDHTEPWLLDLSTIDDFHIDKGVRLWRRYSQGAVSALVTLRSNQGPVQRRVVIFCLTESARCPITSVQILPPGKLTAAGF